MARPIQRRPSRSFRSGVQPVDRRGGGRGSAPNCRTGWRRSARCRPKWCGVSHTTMISRWRDRCSHSPRQLAEADLVTIARTQRRGASARHCRARPNCGGGHRCAGPPRCSRRRSPGGGQSRRAPVGTRLFHARRAGEKRQRPGREGRAAPGHSGAAVPRPPARRPRPLVRQRLLASATPAMQAEIRRLLAKDLQPTRATAPHRTTRRRNARSRRCAKAARSMRRPSSNSPTKGQYAETVAAVASLCAVPTAVVDRLMGAERPDPVLILVQIGRLVVGHRGGPPRSAAGRSRTHRPRLSMPSTLISIASRRHGPAGGAVLADAIG